MTPTPAAYRSQGGYSIFFRIRRLGPSIYRSPQKILGISSIPQKIFEILATPKLSQFCTLTLKKTINCIEMTRKLAQFCDDPKKISTKSSYPQKLFIFLKTPKNIEIQIFEPKKKNGPSLRMCENIRVPPWDIDHNWRLEYISLTKNSPLILLLLNHIYWPTLPAQNVY